MAQRYAGTTAKVAHRSEFQPIMGRREAAAGVSTFAYAGNYSRKPPRRYRATPPESGGEFRQAPVLNQEGRRARGSGGAEQEMCKLEGGL